jgi:hypothetical protein
VTRARHARDGSSRKDVTVDGRRALQRSDRPHTSEGEHDLCVGPRLRRARLWHEAIDVQQVEVLLAARTRPFLHPSRQAKKPEGRRLTRSSRDPTAGIHPIDARGGHGSARRGSRTSPRWGTAFKARATAADAKGDRSPQEAASVPQEAASVRWRTTSRSPLPCARANARIANERSSSMRSQVAARSAHVRWTKTPWRRSSSPRRRRTTHSSQRPIKSPPEGRGSPEQRALCLRRAGHRSNPAPS